MEFLGRGRFGEVFEDREMAENLETLRLQREQRFARERLEMLQSHVRLCMDVSLQEGAFHSARMPINLLRDRDNPVEVIRSTFGMGKEVFLDILKKVSPNWPGQGRDQTQLSCLSCGGC